MYLKDDGNFEMTIAYESQGSKRFKSASGQPFFEFQTMWNIFENYIKIE